MSDARNAAVREGGPAAPLLAVAGIEKSFPVVLALSGVSFEVAPGEVHALLGENGAGKSTLIKIISGVYQADAGTIHVDGRPLRFDSPDDARRAGIATIYQELLLFRDLTVAENVFMGHAPRGRGGRLDWKAMAAKTEALLASLEIVDLAPSRVVGSLSVGNRQRVEILLAAQRTQLGRSASSPTAADQTALEELERLAVARQPDRFLALLAQSLNCSENLARRIVDDSSGEPLAIALTALGAANEVLVRVLISNDLLVGSSFQRIRALANLNNALDRNAAILVIEALRDEPLHRRRQLPIESVVASSTSRGAPARQTPVMPSSARLPGAPGKAPERIVAR